MVQDEKEAVVAPMKHSAADILSENARLLALRYEMPCEVADVLEDAGTKSFADHVCIL